MLKMRWALTRAICPALILSIAGAAVAEDAALERGRYLMNGIVACGNCHTPMGPDGPLPGKELAGGTEIVEEGHFTARVPNITPDAETGIGSWTDAQIGKAIREGLRPDGSLIGPPMPFEVYRNISDSDLKAIIAYLRSVPPVKNKVAKSSYQIELPPNYGPPVPFVADPPRGDKIAYGAYLAGPLGHCTVCHTPMGATDGPDFAYRLGAGGLPLSGPWGVSISANITPDPETGIGKWSDEQIKKAITDGVRPDGARLAPPMPYAFYRSLRSEDLDAIVAYLRSLPPIEHAVK